MQNAPNAFNPAEVWLQATMSAATTMMAMVNQAAGATVSMWSTPLGATAADTSKNQAATEPYRYQSQLPSQRALPSLTATQPTEPFRSWFAEPRAASPEAATPVRSWYRSPYRTPFDPMFWMSPGHPVDHIQDWVAMMPMAAMVQAAMSPPGTMPGFPRMPSFKPPMASTGFDAANPWLAQPWFKSWQSMFDLTPMMAPLAASQPVPAPYNVIDFGPAFAAYRTAGGHASAQIVRTYGDAASAISPKPRTDHQIPSVFDFFRIFQR